MIHSWKVCAIVHVDMDTQESAQIELFSQQALVSNSHASIHTHTKASLACTETI
eukprot:m.108427 g.108427  ORF g.108427 m.108427 type:complete len:54 (-) comp13346_c0_seq1:1930-2091(-)